MTRVRAGLIVFRSPRLGAIATVAQLAAWALQCLSCYVLLVALGLDKQAPASAPRRRSCSRSTSPRCCRPRRRTSASSRPRAPPCFTPAGTSGSATGVAYGVILQAVEVTTAILMGMPALLKEGMSWREVRLRAMHATPVKLPARPSSRVAAAPSDARDPERARPIAASAIAGSPSSRARVVVAELGEPGRVLVGAGDQLVGGLPGRSSAGSPTSSRSRRPAGGGRRSPASTARARRRSRRDRRRPIDGRVEQPEDLLVLGLLGAGGVAPRVAAALRRARCPRSARTRACSHSAMPSAVWTPRPWTNSCSANSPSASSLAISSVTSSPAVTACRATTSSSPEPSGR